MKTKPAVISFRSFGSGPQRKAIATMSRNNTDPITAPVIVSPRRCEPDQRLADDHAGESPDNHSDAHLDISEALVLRQQRTRKGDEPVGQSDPEHGHVSITDSQGADHLVVVTCATHGRPQVCAKEDVQHSCGSEGGEEAAARTDASRALTSQPHRNTLSVPLDFIPDPLALDFSGVILCALHPLPLGGGSRK